MIGWLRRLLGWAAPMVAPPQDARDVAPQGGTVMAPPWLTIAAKELGQHEVPGRGNNPRIVEYHKRTALSATDDSVPWCSSFVNWVLWETGYKGTGSAAARSWLGFGQRLPAYRYGCIVVLKRGNSPWQGHVGFAIDQTDVRVKVLGGNQANAVTSQWYSKSDLLGYRWPTDSDRIVVKLT